jgi:hypothetical protein
MKPLSGILRGAALLLGSLALLAGCGGGDSDTTVTASTGTLKLSITDAPACGYDNVFITVKEVRVHQSEDAVDGDEGWQTIPVIDAPKRIDLLELTNGVLEELGQAVLPAGKYTQMRLILVENGVSPYANALMLSGSGNEVALKTPSAQQTGIKMNVDISVEPDTVADFVIDFDACKSVVKAGASGLYLLKPVVSVIPVLSTTAQRIVGYLDTTTLEPGGSTLVSAQKDGVVIRSTAPDVDGMFVLFPLPVDTYDLVIASSQRATAVMTGVPVRTTVPTEVSSDTARIALVSSATKSATGYVSVSPKPDYIYATVRALQTFDNGPTVEVASMAVDANSGFYEFMLPTEAPRLAAYAGAPPPASIDFDADPTAAGKYVLKASVAGQVKTANIDLVLNGDEMADFSFVAVP